MQQQGSDRVFVKLSHGSAASGVVAYRANSRFESAITTVERVREDGKTFLKALFIGDVNHAKFYFAPVDYYNINIGYILLAYPQLEILKIRGVNYYKRFSLRDRTLPKSKGNS